MSCLALTPAKMTMSDGEVYLVTFRRLNGKRSTKKIDFGISVAPLLFNQSKDCKIIVFPILLLLRPFPSLILTRKKIASLTVTHCETFFC